MVTFRRVPPPPHPLDLGSALDPLVTRLAHHRRHPFPRPPFAPSDPRVPEEQAVGDAHRRGEDDQPHLRGHPPRHGLGRRAPRRRHPRVRRRLRGRAAFRPRRGRRNRSHFRRVRHRRRPRARGALAREQSGRLRRFLGGRRKAQQSRAPAPGEAEPPQAPRHGARDRGGERGEGRGQGRGQGRGAAAATAVRRRAGRTPTWTSSSTWTISWGGGRG